jgi:hypothetical protein
MAKHYVSPIIFVTDAGAICKRVHNHGKTLNAQEKQRLITYLTTQLAKRTPPAPQPSPAGAPLPP